MEDMLNMLGSLWIQLFMPQTRVEHLSHQWTHGITHVSLPPPQCIRRNKPWYTTSMSCSSTRSLGQLWCVAIIHKDYLAKLEDARLGLAKKTSKEIFDHVIR